MQALSDTQTATATAAAGSEQEILRRCLSGDWSDYGRVVERYQGLVWSAVDAVVDDPASVEDVVQEVFVRVYQKLHSFGFRSSFSSWLWRLARNHALGWRRRRGRRPAVASLDAAPLELPGNGATPQALYEDAARQQALRTLLARLPQPYREVLNLHYSGGGTYEEIAALTGMPLNTVRTRLRRARLSLAAMAREAGWD